MKRDRSLPDSGAVLAGERPKNERESRRRETELPVSPQRPPKPS